MTMRMLALEERIAALRPLLDAGRAGHREWVETTFAATIRRARRGPARERLTMQLVVATDLYGWSVLRRSLGPEDTVRAMADMLWAIVERRPKGVKR